MKTKNASQRRTRPLAKPPKHPSRKQARKLTTEFHRLTRLRDAASKARDEASVSRYNELIDRMGGRKEYQRASQTSTSFFSTSKWVLGFLSRNGWLHGIPQGENTTTITKTSPSISTGPLKREQTTAKIKRPTRLMEVGAINTELLDAADRTLDDQTDRKRYNLQVRALDLNSMSPKIEQADFLQIPILPENRYDVIVCSMVLNCVTTPEQRGEMMFRLSSFTAPGGLVFLTIPRTCLNLSPFLDRETFVNMLERLGLVTVETKESPKIAFFVLEKLETRNETPTLLNEWMTLRKIRQGKKFRNDFSVVFASHHFALDTENQGK